MKTPGLLSIAALSVLLWAVPACNSFTGIDDLRIRSDEDGAGGSGSSGAGTTGATTGGGGAPSHTTGAGSTTAGSTSSGAGAGTSGSSTTVAASSSSSSATTGGGPACNYPSGPYGVDSGDTVSSNLSWQGYPEGSSQVASISIQDYFDCDGSKGINAILILQSATWCGVCQEEASGLNDEASAWSAKGIKVLTLMIEDNNGFPASTGTALAWKNAFDLTKVAVAADPDFSFAHSGSIGLPYSIVVDPRTMKVVTTEEGYSGDFSTLEQLAQKNSN